MSPISRHHHSTSYVLAGSLCMLGIDTAPDTCIKLVSLPGPGGRASIIGWRVGLLVVAREDAPRLGGLSASGTATAHSTREHSARVMISEHQVLAVLFRAPSLDVGGWRWRGAVLQGVATFGGLVQQCARDP